MYLCMYVCMYVCMHVCMYVCMYVCHSLVNIISRLTTFAAIYRIESSWRIAIFWKHVLFPKKIFNINGLRLIVVTQGQGLSETFSPNRGARSLRSPNPPSCCIAGVLDGRQDLVQLLRFTLRHEKKWKNWKEFEGGPWEIGFGMIQTFSSCMVLFNFNSFKMNSMDP